MKQAEQSIFSKMTKFSAREIQELVKQAKNCLSSAYLKVKKAPRSGAQARALLVIPKKVGNAVVRNKIRRRIKNILYQEKFYTDDYDYIIYAYTGLDQLSFEQLKELLLKVKTCI